MVWITKREIMYYIVLSQIFRDRVFNIGEALDILLLFGSKHTARKIIKILTSRGFLERVDMLNYRVRDVESALLRSIKDYMTERLYKRLKSLGFNIEIMQEHNVKKIIIRKCDDNTKHMINVLGNIIDIRCA